MNELIEAISFLFTQAWRFFSEVDVPGLGISFGSLFIGLFLMAFALKLIFAVLAINMGSGGDKNDK